MKQTNRVLILSEIVAFILLTIGIIFAWSTPVTGYEPDIYASTPLIFWIGIIFSYFISTVIILLSAKENNTIPNYVKKSGIILIILTSLALASLCLIRGYFGINITGDTGTHIGELKTVINTGLIATYYPNIYLGPGSFALLTGNTVLSTINIYPIFYLGIYLIGVFLLAREIFPNKIIVILTTLVALYLPFGSAPYISGYEHVLFVGMQSTIRLIPILLYLVIKTCKTHSKALFVTTGILCISLVFYHPMASLLVLFLFGSILFFNILNKIIHKEWKNYDIKLSILMILTVGALFFLWSWKMFGPSIAKGVISLLTISEADISERNAGELLSFASDAAGYGFDVLTIVQMGAINLFIYTCLVIGGLYYLLRCFKQNKRQYLGYLYVYIGLLGVATLAFMVMNIGFKYSRFLDEIYLGGIISAGLVLHLVLKRVNKRISKRGVGTVVVAVCVLMVVCGASVITIHSSPISHDSGYQTTHMEYTGAETLLPLIDYNKNSTGIHMTGLQRYVHAIYGSAFTVGSNAYGDTVIISTDRGGTDYAEGVPHHFGYDTGISSLNELYGADETIFIIEKDRKYYQAYYPELMWDRWEPQDFEQLGMDKGLEEVYNNGGLEMYLVF